MVALHLVAGIIWGSLAAQFIVQNFTSSSLAVIYLSGFMFSPVSKSRNARACLVMVAQSLVFLVLFFGGNWLANKYIDYDAWNAIAIASLGSFWLMIVYGVVQVPGKLLLAELSAWQPFFAEAAVLAPDPVAFARQFQKSKVKKSTLIAFVDLVLSKDEARRIVTNFAKLRETLRKPQN